MGVNSHCTVPIRGIAVCPDMGLALLCQICFSYTKDATAVWIGRGQWSQFQYTDEVKRAGRHLRRLE
jgi:hypothetical protein